MCNIIFLKSDLFNLTFTWLKRTIFTIFSFRSFINILISCKYINHSNNIFCLPMFFPGLLAFCKKAMERVNSEKNILNSSVEWSGVEWRGVENFDKSYICVHHQIGLNELINMMYFIFCFIAYFSRNWRKCS